MGVGTLGVDELFGDRVVGLITCEGTGDVVGVNAPLGGVAQVIFHGVQVVEVGVQVRVHQDRGVEEDGEGQVEVEREVGEDQGETLIMDDMRMTMKTQGRLEPMRCV